MQEEIMSETNKQQQQQQQLNGISDWCNKMMKQSHPITIAFDEYERMQKMAKRTDNTGGWKWDVDDVPTNATVHEGDVCKSHLLNVGGNHSLLELAQQGHRTPGEARPEDVNPTATGGGGGYNQFDNHARQQQPLSDDEKGGAAFSSVLESSNSSSSESQLLLTEKLITSMLNLSRQSTDQSHLIGSLEQQLQGLQTENQFLKEQLTSLWNSITTTATAAGGAEETRESPQNDLRRACDKASQQYNNNTLQNKLLSLCLQQDLREWDKAPDQSINNSNTTLQNKLLSLCLPREWDKAPQQFNNNNNTLEHKLLSLCLPQDMSHKNDCDTNRMCPTATQTHSSVLPYAEAPSNLDSAGDCYNAVPTADRPNLRQSAVYQGDERWDNNCNNNTDLHGSPLATVMRWNDCKIRSTPNTDSAFHDAAPETALLPNDWLVELLRAVVTRTTQDNDFGAAADENVPPPRLDATSWVHPGGGGGGGRNNENVPWKNGPSYPSHPAEADSKQSFWNTLAAAGGVHLGSGTTILKQSGWNPTTTTDHPPSGGTTALQDAFSNTDPTCQLLLALILLVVQHMQTQELRQQQDEMEASRKKLVSLLLLSQKREPEENTPPLLPPAPAGGIGGNFRSLFREPPNAHLDPDARQQPPPPPFWSNVKGTDQNNKGYKRHCGSRTRVKRRRKRKTSVEPPPSHTAPPKRIAFKRKVPHGGRSCDGSRHNSHGNHGNHNHPNNHSNIEIISDDGGGGGGGGEQSSSLSSISSSTSAPEYFPVQI